MQAEALDLEKTVLQTVEEAAEDWRINDIKSLLGRCNFKAEMLERKVAYLSGGEKVIYQSPCSAPLWKDRSWTYKYYRRGILLF